MIPACQSSNQHNELLPISGSRVPMASRPKFNTTKAAAGCAIVIMALQTLCGLPVTLRILLSIFGWISMITTCFRMFGKQTCSNILILSCKFAAAVVSKTSVSLIKALELIVSWVEDEKGASDAQDQSNEVLQYSMA